MKTLSLPSGRQIPQLGQGTWEIGHDRSRRKKEVEALRLGIDLGMTLIDTAEMYGEGESERVIGEAIEDRRKDVYLVSKVYPHNGTEKGVVSACHASLKRLKTTYLDLYLLHWRGSIPFEETLAGFQRLKNAGDIMDFGVSNFDVDELGKAATLPGGDEIASNQVLYNLKYRGPEYDLLPYCIKKQIAVMAYSPLDKPKEKRRGMLENPGLKAVADNHGVTPAQIALAWLLQQQVVIIPKSGNPDHVMENSKATSIILTKEDLASLDRIFPPPAKKVSLAMR